jgi:hypothetical protein
MCETDCDSRNEIIETDANQTEEPLSGCCALTRRGFITRSTLASAGLVIAPAVVMEALVARPAEAAQLFRKPSAADQKKLGQQAAQQVLQQYREVKDSRATHFRTMGQRLVSALSKEDQNKWDYNFRVWTAKR